MKVYRFPLRGRKGDSYLYTTRPSPEELRDEDTGEMLAGYAWDFDTTEEAQKFLIGIMCSTRKHTVELPE